MPSLRTLPALRRSGLLATCLWLGLAGPLPAAEVAGAAGDVAFLDALTWGATASSVAELRAQGRERWLREQLHPTGRPLAPAVQAQLDALQPAGLLSERVAVFDVQVRAANAAPDPETKKAAQQAYQSALNDAVRAAAGTTILRALYAPDQLRERLVWFWFNRFNVHQYKANLRATVGDYVDVAIRPHALGRFRDLLGATLRHPAMLRYLDNADNAVGRINENYARELLELHTMGVGSGYSQADVEALARVLTGVSIDPRPEDPKLKPEWQPLLVRQGLFVFNPARHDFGDKVLLGRAIKGRGFAEVEEALDLLARQPATARHVSRALATYLTGSPPADALVERLAAVYLRTDGDVAALVEGLVRAPEFVPALGQGFKDPMRYVLSALRLAYDGRVILNTAPVQGWLNRLGEGLFNHTGPDGYPLDAASWTGPGQMATRFEVARQIGSGAAGLFRPPTPEAAEEPAFPVLQNGLYFSTLAAGLSEPTRAALARAVSPQDWNTLFLASPEFMR